MAYYSAFIEKKEDFVFFFPIKFAFGKKNMYLCTQENHNHYEKENPNCHNRTDMCA